MYVFVPFISDLSHFSLMMSGNKNFPFSRASTLFHGFHKTGLSFVNIILCFTLYTSLENVVSSNIKNNCHFLEPDVFICKLCACVLEAFFKILVNFLQTYGNLATMYICFKCNQYSLSKNFFLSRFTI